MEDNEGLVDLDDILNDFPQPSLAINDDEIPIFIMNDGSTRKTYAPELFNTKNGFIEYADEWLDILNNLFPGGWEENAKSASSEFGIALSDPPGIWLLVAMTLE